MLPAKKPNYALLGRRQHYSIGNQQAKKDAIFTQAIDVIHNYLNSSLNISIPNFVANIYDGHKPQLNPIREALKSNSLFPCTTCLSASGNKILAYLAVLHDKNCLKENGDIDLEYTKQIIQSFFSDKTKDTIQFDDSAIRNLKSKYSHFQFGKNRFAHLNLSLTNKNNIDTFHYRIQAADLTTHLFQTWHEKQLAATQEALRKMFDINYLNTYAKITPLMLAIRKGWLDVAKYRLLKSSNNTINAINSQGDTALLIACQKLTDIPFLTQLLERSSDAAVNAVNRKGDTALSCACYNLKDIPFLTQLLARSSDAAINATNGNGDTALSCACDNLTDIPFLTQLLARSSNKTINAINCLSNTALLHACQKLTDIPFLTQLLARSSDETIQAVGQKGNTALLIACNNLTDISFLTQLLARSSDKTINAVNQRGNTALLLACLKLTDIPFLTQLLARSSDETIQAVGQQGNTALLIACNNLTDISFLTQLLARSSDKTINAVHDLSITTLWLACLKLTDIPFLTQLLARSSDETINAVNQSGGTALLLACNQLTDIPFLTQLLARSSDKTINAVNRNGDTALSCACYNLKDIPLLTQLLARSPDATINAVNQLGDTALLLACQKLRDIPFLTQLLARSSDATINAVNQSGDTALISLVWKASNQETAQHFLPLLLPHLTWTNFRSAYTRPNSNTNTTAWQRAHEHGPGPWSDIADRIGEAMIVECAQSQIPWGRLHHTSATQKKNLTKEIQTTANVCEEILYKITYIPLDILGIIRNYNESPFSTPMETVNAINGFLERCLRKKEQYQPDGSQLFQSVDDALLALHDHTSLLNLSLAEYASIMDAPQSPINDAPT